MMGSSPLRVAARNAAPVLARMLASPVVIPFDDHGVPQHNPSMPGGTSSESPTRSQSCSRLSCTPELFPAGPNMVPTQAGKYTASGAATGSGRERAAPPDGKSEEYSGTVSRPSTVRASRLAGTTTAAGTFAAASSTSPAPRVMRLHRVAAPAQARFSARPDFSRRSRFTSNPVLISTGHAVWHMPSTAQVCTDS